MARLEDPDVVEREYANEAGLLTRRAAYAGSDGVDANDVLIEAIVEGSHARTLEVGCGPGELAERLRDERGITVSAINTSARMVELADARGVDARAADVQELPFGDGSFDCVIAAWMLYHVPDLSRALQEIRRVLSPGGRLIAVTNSERHLLELWQLVGLDRYELQFNAENARAILEQHFARVEQRDVEGTVTFADRESARRHVAASIKAPDLAERVPELDAPLHATRRNCILIAIKSTEAEAVVRERL